MVRFLTEDTSFSFRGRNLCRHWLSEVASKENKTIGVVSVVFCSDPYILDVNRRFLGHDYYTDIITFDYCSGCVLSGDLIISIDTVRANAREYGASLYDELHRVIVHGLLHLIGYDDHTEEDIAVMRSKENEALLLLSSLNGGVDE